MLEHSHGVFIRGGLEGIGLHSVGMEYASEVHVSTLGGTFNSEVVMCANSLAVDMSYSVLD